MRVSVVVPLYNKAAWVRRALDSISGQTFSDFEVIVVDDGSTDGGDEIVAAHADPRFRLLRQVNAGPGAARNRGIAEARGELLASLDADDEWLPDYLAQSLQQFEGYGSQAACVSAGWIVCPSGRSREPQWRARGIREGVIRVTPATPPLRLVHLLAAMSPCTTLARTAALRKWGGYYPHRCVYAEDAHLWLKILLNEPVAFSPAPLVRVHADASGLSSNTRGAHPVEPFLEHPQEIRDVCPPPLADLLERFFVIRAFKTACVLGYWGQWREASALMRRFRLPGDWRLPYYFPALFGRTPVAGLLGECWRALRF